MTNKLTVYLCDADGELHTKVEDEDNELEDLLWEVRHGYVFRTKREAIDDRIKNNRLSINSSLDAIKLYRTGLEKLEVLKNEN
jgi:hypothetical protein